MPRYDLKLVHGRLVIDMGMDENDVLNTYGYDGTPNTYDGYIVASAKTIGTVELTQKQFEVIQAEYKNGGECGWCDNVVSELRECHQFDSNEDGEKMCHDCWNHDREMYLGSYGEDIGPFNDNDNSKPCVHCKTWIKEEQQLDLTDPEFPEMEGKIICEECAQVMGDLAP